MEQNNTLDTLSANYIKIAVEFPILECNCKHSFTYFILLFPREFYRSFVFQRCLIEKKNIQKLTDAPCGEIPILSLIDYVDFLRLCKKNQTNG